MDGPRAERLCMNPTNIHPYPIPDSDEMLHNISDRGLLRLTSSGAPEPDMTHSMR